MRVEWRDTSLNESTTKGFVVRKACKGFSVIAPVLIIDHPMAAEKSTRVIPAAAMEHTPLLKVSGNILYDVNYRSRIDTPYAENNIYQHTLQTRLDFVYKDQYPFKIYLTTRFSNSNLFRKYTDINFQYLQSDFARLMKNRILGAVESYLASRTGQLDSIKRLMDQKRAAIAALNQSIQKPDNSQRLVEEKEKEMYGSNRKEPATETDWNHPNIQDQLNWQKKYKFSEPDKKDTSSAFTVNNNGSKSMEGFYATRDNMETDKRKLDSLLTDFEKLDKIYKNLSIAEQAKQQDWKKEIEQSKDAKELSQTMQQLHLPDSLLPKGYKTLYAIQSFNIGRSVANYSELSVKNVSITGLQIEYNPHYYYAFAAGKVDYRFRDYIIPDQPRSSQYVALARFGRGMKNGNHVIFTYYTGRRQFYNSSIAAQPNNPVPEYNLAGITIEGFYKINKTTSLVAEIAKSTIPYYSLDSTQRKSWMNSVTRFKDRSNEAYSLRLNSYIPKTQTRLSGYVKYLGANFQSFSTFTTGAAQLIWMGRVEQPFFKKKLTIISSLQQNDYNNPFVTTAYKSSSMLASFQASLRIRKWPMLTVGYYPSYQLTKVGDNNYTESRYYTMLANASYYYQVKAAQLSTYLVYSQFYNQASDSGFVYFNSKNLLLSQYLTINRWSILVNLSESINTGYNIYTVENNDQFTVNRFLSVGAGIKRIRNSLVNDLQWGYSGNLTLRIPKLGDIQLMMDKGYIPGLNHQLVENRLGRLTYFKTF